MFMTFKNQNGVVLITGLLVLLVLSAVGAVATFNTVTDIQISGNVRDIKQAFYLAEAGISHAGDVLDQATAGEWTSYATYQTLIADTTLGDGNYTVTVEDAGGDLRRVVSAGRTNIGGYAEIEAVFGTGGPWSPSNAIYIDGDLMISGNPTVSGGCGRIHANEDLTMSGNPIIQSTATSSQTASTSGDPTINGVTINTDKEKKQYRKDSSNKPEETIPDIITANFYDLGSMSFDHTLICSGPHKGKFRNGDGHGKPIPPYGGWEFEGNKWVISGNNADNLNVKVDCEVDISGNPGRDKSPWSSTMYVDGDFKLSGDATMAQVTVIATGDVTLGGGLVGPSSQGGSAEATVIAGGHIEVSGNPDMKSPTSGDFKSLLLIAGTDLKINGNPSQSLKGLMGAREQIDVSGDPTLEGFIIAKDVENKSGLIDKNSISGNMSITYDCDLVYQGFSTTTSMISWRQL